jgi:hypothetical protein
MAAIHILGFTVGAGAIFTAFWAILKYVVGGWVNDFKTAITEPIARIETQICNHNSHSFANLEEQGKRTNELLEKIHDGQIEMSGFLKGISGK